MRGTALLFLIPAALLLSSSQASAASKQVQERMAKKACLAGDPAKGVEVLAELYVDTNDITYIFNQGRCFEQNRRYEDAIGRFREYLTKGEDHLSDERQGRRQEAHRHL
jgi:outer membrane lipoprotein-sorting protein